MTEATIKNPNMQRAYIKSLDDEIDWKVLDQLYGISATSVLKQRSFVLPLNFLPFLF